ncbi:hypothetical protein JCM5350_006777 [Sporobolomyces pararoseus]
MSFSQLPTETIQLIVAKCAEADEVYKGSKEAEEIITGNKKKKELDWKGKSCSAISLVSSTLRSLAIKHVFRTLPAAKVLDDVFQYSLFESAAHCFTEIVFDEIGRPRPSTAALFKTVLHVMPQLPNLRSIVGLKDNYLADLVGSTALSHIPNPRRLDPKQIRARNVFLSTAEKITRWGVEINEDSLEVLVDANTSRIRSLSISSPSSHRISIFDSPSSRFASILAKLPNLETLGIHQHSWDVNGQTMKQIVDPVFEVPFSFANTLRSLELNFSGNCDDPLSKELRFASRFPSLRRLILNVNGHDFWENGDEDIYSFPTLEYLEIKGLQYNSLGAFFNKVELLSIVEIHFVSLSIDPYTWPALDELTDPLNLLPVSLARVRISRTSGFNSSLPLDFAEGFGIGPLKLDVETLCKMGLVEVEEVDSDSPEAVEYSWLKSVCGDPFHSKSEEILKWAIQRVEEMKHSDLRGGKEMMKALKAVDDLKRWAES